MKHWLNKLSVWQRIFVILAFGFLIFMIWVWYREGKEYIVFLVWLVYVAAAYGLCLGGRKVIIWMMPWLNKLSGWHRIFLVYACTHLVIAVFISAFMSEIVSRRSSLHDANVIVLIFIFGIMPIGLIYGLGRSVGWALRGFRKDKDR